MTAPRTLYMLCGVPASGKSTWTRDINAPDAVIVSTDIIIEQISHSYGLTYNDGFRDLIKFAEAQMYRNLEYFLQNNLDIIWDQTNLTPKVRAAKLVKVPANYRKVAVHFETPPVDILTPRLSSRPGKTIPCDVVESMIGKYVPPSPVEGFDEIQVVKSW